MSKLNFKKSFEVPKKKKMSELIEFKISEKL